MKKQDRQGVRTASDLERKYAIGQSFKKAQGGIQKAAEDASIAKEQAKNASAGLEGVEQNVLAAKALAEDAADAAFRAENKVDNLNLSVDNGSVTAEITLMVGDVEIKRTIHMQGLASLLALKTAGEVQVNGKNIVGTVELTGEQDEEGNWQKVELTPMALVFLGGDGRVSGLAQPEEDSDAANKAYIDRELAKLRQELGLNQE